jgi:hypothetical protein
MKNMYIILFIFLILAIFVFSFLGSKNMTYEGMANNDATNATNLSKEGEKQKAEMKASNKKKDMNLYTMRENFDNYNHYQGMQYPSMFYGQDGSTVKIIDNNNKHAILVKNANGTTSLYVVPGPSSQENKNVDITSYTFYSQNGAYAKVVKDNNGHYIVRITDTSGNTVVFTDVNPKNNVATVATATPADGTSITPYATPYTNPVLTTSSVAGTGVAGTGTATATGSSNYYPGQGIPASMIPSGQEDLYILKSQVVPPVCPACPVNNSCPREEKCPPCPACARCPEPNFSCKAVPNYNAINNEYLPMPVLNSFSGFGM